MNPEAPSVSEGSPLEAAPLAISPPQVSSKLRRLLFFPLKLLLGMIFCQGLLGSILVVGWTYRLAQRSAVKYWWSRSRRPEQGKTFCEFLSETASTSALHDWPNWFLQQKAEGRGSSDEPPISSHASRITHHPHRITHHVTRLPRLLLHSLWLNFWLGLRAILNTWVLTIPACLFWWFGWYDGWNNSFNKGYEQAPVGPIISISGIILFIAAMFALPLAQARQAVTGHWRSFYDVRLIWKIVRIRWLACAGLASLYCAFALPLNVLKTGPIFWASGKPMLEHLSDTQVLKSLDSYFFWCALVMLPAFVILRLVAMRIYASGILRLLQIGQIQASALADNEREVLERLTLLEAQPPPERHRFVRLLAWAGTRLGRTISGAALFFIWLGFVAQIYIAEFFNTHGGRGWLNQPLVQLPWFHYVPAHLKNPAGEVAGALLFLLVVTLVASVRRAFQANRGRQAPDL
jgi:hypothetical protein